MNIKEAVKNTNAKKYVFLAVVLAIFVFVSARISGYIVAEGSYNTELANLTEKYSSLNQSYNQCAADLSNKSARISLLESEKTGLTGSLSAVNSSLVNCNADFSAAKKILSEKETAISNLTSEKDALTKNYNALAANGANAVCCVKRIFDKNLATYYIENNNIVCTSDVSKTAFRCE
ncbi:MAG: hypothetical protein QMD85_03740 [Candidatus Aenigmarchaeota archaeon]|nr:hypothetical protein [Candidatus Aenigmarchaeota archaeon]MDI6722671.1 hypothetical protein [Candidatus Aenigmarchaeota archaeon]